MFSGSHYVDFINDRMYQSATPAGFIAGQGDVLQYKISTRNAERRGKRFIEDPYRRPLCVHLSSLQPSLTLPVRTFWGNKRKWKEADYIFMHQSCWLSQLDNIYYDVAVQQFSHYATKTLPQWLNRTLFETI